MNKKILILITMLFLITILISAGNDLNESNFEWDNYNGINESGDSLNCTLIGGWFGGPCFDILVSDTIAFVGNGGTIAIAV